jgi:hypothetical protein
MTSTHTNTIPQESVMNDSYEQTTVGWHADRSDPMITRYWNGTKWGEVRCWSGTEWVKVPGAPLPPPAASAQQAAPVAKVATALASSSLTFKVLIGSAVALALGYFMPLVTVTNEFGEVASGSLSDVGGIGLLVLVAAAATAWLALPSRHGVIGKGSMIGVGVSAALVGLMVAGGFAAFGKSEQDLGFGALPDNAGFGTITRDVQPSLGFFLLLLAVGAQVVGIFLAIKDRRTSAA